MERSKEKTLDIFQDFFLTKKKFILGLLPGQQVGWIIHILLMCEKKYFLEVRENKQLLLKCKQMAYFFDDGYIFEL